MLHVRVGGVDFHGLTSKGFLIGPRGFDGWEGRPALRSGRAERPNGHGSFSLPAYVGARLVTLKGMALADSEAELEHLEDVLNGLGMQDTQITVASEKGTRWAIGRAEGDVKWERIGGAHHASFEVSFFCADPRKFGESRRYESSGSNVDAWHRGNFPATPRFRVAGFSAGYSLFRPGGGTFRVGARTPGTVDEIDFNTGQVRRDGVLVTGGVGVGDLWTVPGGATTAWRVEGVGTGSGSTGTAAMYLPDTFI